MALRRNTDYAAGLALAVLSTALGPVTGVPSLILARRAEAEAADDTVLATRAQVVRVCAIFGMSVFVVLLIGYLIFRTGSNTIAPVVERQF